MITVPAEAHRTDEVRRLLQMPERICHEVQSKGLGDRFYFMSAHKSPHDEAVLRKTGAKFISKYGLPEMLEIILGA
jgi:hypothetical protein